LFFYTGFIIDLKVIQGHYYNWLYIKYYFKKHGGARVLDSPHAFWVARAGPSGHRTSPYRDNIWKVFTLPAQWDIVCAPNTPLVWRLGPFLFFFFFLLLLLLLFKSCTSAFKISNKPLQFLFPLHLVHILFIVIFLFWIIYKITNIFQFHPLLYFNLLNLVLIFYCYLFCLRSFFRFFFISSSFIDFFLSNASSYF